jgi:hypothetical protein
MMKPAAGLIGVCRHRPTRSRKSAIGYWLYSTSRRRNNEAHLGQMSKIRKLREKYPVYGK